MKVLITGGAGYIGSHAAICLLDNDYEVSIVDNLSNSCEEAIRRIETITKKNVVFYNQDLCDRVQLDKIFSEQNYDAVIHFAGYKSVGESVSNPVEYYKNNIGSTLTLVECMSDHNVKKLIFSSSATVYGVPESLPLTEESRTGEGITNPYGQTKYMIEQIIRDICVSNTDFEGTLLRYFNPIGAHKSGLIGEDPKGVPNNIFPYICQVAIGKLEKLEIYGDDYDTPDGTGIRDYIHVMDVAEGHLAALKHSRLGCHTYNLGTGKGTSVLELLSEFSDISKKKIPYAFVARRQGDVATCYADPSLAKKELGWKATRNIKEACLDSWNWQAKNPADF